MFERKFPGLSIFSSSGANNDKPEAPPVDEASFREPRDPTERYNQVTFRLKSVAGIGFILLAMFAVMEVLNGDSRPRPAINGYSDRPLETRSVEHARRKVGFLERTFCRGGLRRSSFCD